MLNSCPINGEYFILVRENPNSDPVSCMKVLSKFKRQYHLLKDDELWLVIDVDRWGDKKLAEVSRLCRQKGFKIAISNPCFESWLLLHQILVDEYDSVTKRKLSNTCQSVVTELKNVVSHYNKSNLRIEDYLDKVIHAIDEGKKIDDPNEIWPRTFGSKVFLLVESMIGLSRTD